jgi:hypothetical protein
MSVAALPGREQPDRERAGPAGRRVAVPNPHHSRSKVESLVLTMNVTV